MTRHHSMEYLTIAWQAVGPRRLTSCTRLESLGYVKQNAGNAKPFFLSFGILQPPSLNDVMCQRGNLLLLGLETHPSRVLDHSMPGRLQSFGRADGVLQG